MTQVFCANCGQALRPTDKFCYNCGAKVVPIKMAPKVEAEAPKPEIINRVPKRPEPAPAKVQEEKPRFHMDESMSWNTDGYPEPKKRSSEEPDFSWADSSAQDRIKKRQEEGRKALYEEQAAREAAKQKAREEAEKQFAEPPEAEEVVKAVEAESIMPASELSLDDVPEELKPVEEVQTAAEAPAPEPVVQEAPVEVPEATVVAPEPEVAPAVEAAQPEPEVIQPEPAEPQVVPAAKVPGFTPAPEEEYEGYDEVPTIESIERAAAEEQARQTEKDIFGYTLDDVDAREKEGQNQVADKFYTYSKKNEEFQELLDQENDKLKTNRPVEVPVQEAPEMPEETEVTNDVPEGPIETGGFVGVQLPETPMEADAAEKEPETIEPEKPVETPEFLDGNFGKEEQEAQEKEEEGKSGRTVAAAAGAVAAGAAAIAAVAEKAKAAKAQAEQKAQEAKESVEEKLDTATDKAYDDLDELARKADEAKEKVEAKASDAVDAVDEKLDSVQEKVEEVKTEASDEFAAFAPKAEEAVEEKVEEAKEEAADEFAAFAPKAEEVKEAVEEKVEEVKTAVEEKPAETKEPASSELFTIPAYNAEEVKETASERAVKIDDEIEKKAEEVKEEVTDSFDQVKEKVEEVKEEVKETKEEVKEEAEDDHKLTYQEVFNNEAEKTQKHTFLKIIAILILLLIILEVVAILIRRFAPDSAAGVQIQQIYEMLFSRFTGR